MAHEPNPTECADCGEFVVYPLENDDGEPVCSLHHEFRDIRRPAHRDTTTDTESAEQAHPLEHVLATYLQEFHDQLTRSMTGEMAEEIAAKIIDQLDDDEYITLADTIEEAADEEDED